MHFQLWQKMAMKFLRSKESPPSPLNIAIYIKQFIFFILIPSINTTSFNYSSFGSTPKDLTFQGDAYAMPSGILLTSDSYYQPIDYSIGRALYAKPVRLWDMATRKVADFSTSFSFVLSIPPVYADRAGDGIAFFFVPEGSDVPPHSDFGYLGLFDPRSSSVNTFVAVEFDTHTNTWDPKFPKGSHHVGINVNSIKSVKTSDAIDLISNQTANARIRYDSTTKNLSVYFHHGLERDRLLVSYVVDLKEVLPEWVNVGLSAARGGGFEYHRIISWKFDSTYFPSKQESSGKKEHKSKATEVIGLAVSILFLIVLVGFILVMWQKKKKKRDRNQDNIISDLSSGPKKYTYSELAQATDYFNENRKLGEGGFGSVYRGVLGDFKMEVAVKKISEGSRQGKKEFRSEVEIISQLRHRHLVQLFGWCHEKGQLLLVYDFMPNGSLDFYLYGGTSLLSWILRYKIAKELAVALQYLHEQWNQCVVHRDIKSSNVMLDSSFTAKLGDFGLARFGDHIGGIKTTNLAGTTGYIAPECFHTGKSGKESDVYSFGVVALEIACGRSVVVLDEEVNKVSLVIWVRELYLSGKLLEAADAKLGKDFDEQQMERLIVVGLWCTTQDYNQRPSMKKAIRVLEMEVPLPDLEMLLRADSMRSMPSNGYSYMSSTDNQPIEMQSFSHNKISSRSSTFHSTSASLLHSCLFLVYL